ncbi:low molecular weight phosphatase family protein [bacterium]|nr:low molecular weight phosphatase family protein [bacterium]
MKRWLENKYGSRRGSLRAHWHFFLYFLGKYRIYRNIEWDSIDRLVFVCKGNICRSAYSEAFAKSLGIEAISCGIHTKLGHPANSTTIEVSASRGYDLSEHQTTPISELKFKETDLVLAMEPWQVEYLSNNFNGSHNCTLLGLWGNPAKPYIHDPYGSSPTYFNNCFNYIEDSIHEVASKISKNRL